MSTNTDSKMAMFTCSRLRSTRSPHRWPCSGPWLEETGRKRDAVLNRRLALCVIVVNGLRRLAWPCSGVRMRRFGELEAMIMDRLWEWGRPGLVREMVDALHD